MDSFEWNKIIGAVLFALLVAFGLGTFSGLIFQTETPETPGYVVAIATEAGSGGGAAEQAAQPIGVLLASADANKGATSAKKCGACHDFTQGGPNKVGPNLWGVVGRPIASHEGYEYDDGMKAFAQEAGNWTFEHLNTFLTDPKGTVPGTKMAFAGLKNDQERANVIAYLRTLSDNPVPLPDAAAAEAPAETQVASADSGVTPTEAPATATPAEEKPMAAAEPEQPAPAEEKPMAAAEPEQAAPAEEKPMAAAPAEEPATSAPAEEKPMAPAEAPAASAPAEEQTAAAATTQPAPAEEKPMAEEPTAPAPAETQTAQTEAPAAAPAAAGAGDAAKGESYAKRCLACHSFEQGGPNKVGPHLFAVVGRPVASVADYNYSDAMKAFSDGGTKVWDDALLDTYLDDPRKVVPGTKMAFAGIKAEADRQNVIAYLNSLK